MPAAETAAEDEGWLIGYVYDASTTRSDLVIIDAHDFAVGAAGQPIPLPRSAARRPHLGCLSARLRHR